MASENTDGAANRFTRNQKWTTSFGDLGSAEEQFGQKQTKFWNHTLKMYFAKTSGKVCSERYTEALSKVTVPNLAAEGKIVGNFQTPRSLLRLP